MTSYTSVQSSWFPHDPLSKMSYASDATHSPTENQAGDSFENTQIKVYVSVWWGLEKSFEEHRYILVRCPGWNLGLKAAWKVITEDSSF